MVEEGCIDDDDNNDTDILDETIEAPNDSDYCEPGPQHLKIAISHPLMSQITRASQLQGGCMTGWTNLGITLPNLPCGCHCNAHVAL